METFAFKQNVALDQRVSSVIGSTTAHSQLSEAIELGEKHVFINYLTEYEGRDFDDVSLNLRSITPKFSDDQKLDKDVQIAIDENYINYYLYSLIYADKPFSLTEKLLEMIPEWLEPAAFLVKAVMNAQTFSPFFPELANHGSKRFDIRCSLDKQSLLDGQLEEVKMSQVWLRDGNKIDMELHFGCSTWLYED